MQASLNLLPLVVFAGAYFALDIYWATGALMLAAGAQTAALKLARQPISTELQLTFWACLVFGSLTLLLRDQAFIQWKTTVVNWSLAACLLVAQLMGRNLIQTLLGRHLKLPAAVWSQLNLGWMAGFAFSGTLNLLVMYNFSMDFWVSYKVFGGFGLTFSYILLTMLYLYRLGFISAPAKDQEGPKAEP